MRKGKNKTGKVEDEGAGIALETYDYAKASGLNFPPDVAEFLNKIMQEDPKEILYQLERASVKEANHQFDQLREELAQEEAERRKLWGKKYPPERGQTPDDFKPQKGHHGRPKRVTRIVPIPFRPKTG